MPENNFTVPRSFNKWAQGKFLHEALEQAEAELSAHANNVEVRWLLIELLCVMGHWERALRQVQAWSSQSGESGGAAQVVRGLIRAENQRMDVFAGRTAAVALGRSTAPPPAWVIELGQALQLQAIGEADAGAAADTARGVALAQAMDTSGSSNLVPAFDWLVDSDTRLGPVCEVVLAGNYRWLAFCDITSVTKAAPASLLELVWSPAELVLRDGTTLKCWLPMRYPVKAGDSDELMTGRKTEWEQADNYGVHAAGQKVWTTSAGDIQLLDLRRCVLDGLEITPARSPTDRRKFSPEQYAHGKKSP